VSLTGHSSPRARCSPSSPHLTSRLSRPLSVSPSRNHVKPPKTTLDIRTSQHQPNPPQSSPASFAPLHTVTLSVKPPAFDIIPLNPWTSFNTVFVPSQSIFTRSTNQYLQYILSLTSLDPCLFLIGAFRLDKAQLWLGSTSGSPCLPPPAKQSKAQHNHKVHHHLRTSPFSANHQLARPDLFFTLLFTKVPYLDRCYRCLNSPHDIHSPRVSSSPDSPTERIDRPTLRTILIPLSQLLATSSPQQLINFLKNHTLPELEAVVLSENTIL
jgi:hypothetical protein